MIILWSFFDYPYLQPVQDPFVFFYAGSHIDPGSLDGGMTQYVRQMGHVLLHRIKTPGKQVAEIMWENLFLLHTCL